MASIIKVGGKWRALIRRKGHAAICRTFPSKTLAAEWARGVESAIDRESYQDMRPGQGITVSELIVRHQDEHKKMGRTAVNILHHIDVGLGPVTLDKLTPQSVIEYVTGRGYGPATATTELAVLGRMLKIAGAVWGMPVRPGIVADAREALKIAGRVCKSRQRDRRPTMDELNRLCDYFDMHSKLPMRDIIWFAVHTAMRAAEITGLRWADLHRDDQTILIRDRKDPKMKIGNDQTVPLLAGAMEIVARQPELGARIFPVKTGTISSIFPRACQALGIEDLRFHDLRHEGASRLFEKGYQIHEVALWTGHRDWAMLKRYTQLRAKDIRRL